jgi:hypothetical protein
VFTGCASKPKAASSSGGVTSGGSSLMTGGADELDGALREISDYLNNRVTPGSKAVFLNITSNWPDLSEYILSSLSENAVNDEVFSVVDRQQLDAIRSELNFQWSGEVSDSSAQEIGQMLGAQTIVSGSVNKIGSVYRIQVRAIAVQSAAVQGQFSQNVDGKGATIAALTERTGSGGASGGTATASGGRQASAQAATPAGPKNGTYTLYPRARATQSGVPRDMYIPQIVVSNDYIVIYFTTTPQGEYRIPAIYGGNAAGDFTVQDLDRPARSYTAVNVVYGGGQATVASISFRRFPATRFKLIIGHHEEPFSFEEIIFGEPDED